MNPFTKKYTLVKKRKVPLGDLIVDIESDDLTTKYREKYGFGYNDPRKFMFMDENGEIKSYEPVQ